jgi:diacylglycerol kinase (ATP)
VGSNSLAFGGQLRSVKCAVRGIAIMLKTQRNAWLHAVAAVAVIAVGAAVRLSVSEWCWIVLAITSVWTAEALNTAFEFLTDVASPDFHPIAEKAKDVAGWCPRSCGNSDGAFFRLVKCTTSRPTWQAATGGARHGQGYQQVGRRA